MIILRFAVFSPLKRSFDYLAPEAMSHELLNTKIGARFILPFGRQRVMGILLSIETQTDVPINKMKSAEACLDNTPIFNTALLKLGQWLSHYYHAPIGDVFFMMLPPPLRLDKKSIPHLTLFELTQLGQNELTEIHNFNTNSIDVNIEANIEIISKKKIIKQEATKDKKKDKKIGKKQGKNQLALGALFLKNTLLFPPDLASLEFNYKIALKAFLEKSWVKKIIQEHVIFKPKTYCIPENLQLNKPQRDVVDSVLKQQDLFQVHLLEGVTGSGKTEVYLEIAKAILAQGKQVLILVPEIGLTPQFLARTQAQLGITVVGIHSQLSHPKRFEIWQAARFNQVQVVIGTRTALFTPMPYLGMIIIDEEHDASYRSRDGVRYSAKDSAIVYAKNLNIPIILGSATPSLEALQNGINQRFNALFLSERAIGSVPEWHLIDCSQNIPVNGLTEKLISAIQTKLALNEQVILFLNRRGFAPVLFCQNCKWMADCPRCDAHLTMHQYSLNCHHCGYKEVKPPTCPACAQDTLTPLGQGTQRIESALQEIFPNETIIRMDRDVIKNRDSLEAALALINNNTARIILGTQMLAKGHDFPNVTLVGVIDTDNLLFAPDYHGEEQLAQLLMQVAGRGGRAAKPATVLIQTYHPEHPIFTQLPKIGYHAYGKKLLEKRSEFQLPPFSYQAHVLAESKFKGVAAQFLETVSHIFETNYPELATLIKISPVMNCSISRRKDFFRCYLLLQTHKRILLNQALTVFDHVLLTHKIRDLRFYMEVDPPENA